MIDEQDPMARANPVTPQELEDLVAMDRQTLFELLEADDRDDRDEPRPSRLRALSGGAIPSGTRAAYVGAMAAAAAAAVAFMLGTSTGGSPVTEVGPADDATITTPPMIDVPPSPLPSTPVPDSAPTTATAVPSTDEPVGGPADDPTTDASSTRASVGPDQEPTTAATIEGPFDPSADLLVLHFDFVHLDDGHAAVAAREITDDLGVTTTHVVAGTTGVDHDGFVHDFAPVLEATWGDRWLDATADRTDAVRRSADAWLTTIDAGGRVWVADGGASDFTTEVVQEVRQRRADLDTVATVRVVQHNDSNEAATAAVDLRVLQDTTTYQRIEDGNDANATADLNRPSDGFEAAALAGPHGAGWAAAFAALPAAELDFSDTVEVLHILGVGLDEVADTDDFARRFLG